MCVKQLSMKQKYIKHALSMLLIGFAILGLSACEQKTSTKTEAAAPSAPSPFILTASIQDIMVSEVDPSADYLWESVSMISTVDGFEQHQPRTEEEWQDVRRKAIVLVEASNLLVMDGRQVVEEGKHLEDEGVEGNLTAAEIQKLVDDEHETFVAFAHGLHEASAQMLTAIDNKDVDALLEAGGVLDTACESCHLKYWYPNQVIPTPQFDTGVEKQ